MNIVYANQSFTIRVRFVAPLDAAPTANIYVNNTLATADIVGSGSGSVWSFAITIPTGIIPGDLVQIEAVGVASGITVYEQILIASVAEWETYPDVPPIVVNPPEGLNKSNGWLLAYGDRNSLEEGIQIHVRTLRGPGVAGYSLDGETFTEASAANGMVQFPYLIRGSVCIAWRGDSKETVRFVVPDADNFSLPEILARP